MADTSLLDRIAVELQCCRALVSTSVEIPNFVEPRFGNLCILLTLTYQDYGYKYYERWNAGREWRQSRD